MERPAAALRDFPSMLSEAELRYLHGLGQGYRGLGQIVDAGCFLGGSTYALASGVVDRRRSPEDAPGDGLAGSGRSSPIIHSYDLFVLDEWTKKLYPQYLEDVEAGQSFRPKFLRLLGSLAELVNVHEGDITGSEWTDGPIEILFLDVCKTWEISDHVMREFLPALIPGESVVIQQDFVHEWLPHIVVGVGWLGDALELVDFVAPSSAVFRPTRAISPAEVPTDMRTALSAEAKLACFDRACVPFGGEPKAVLDCARAVLLAELGHHPDAIAQLARIPAGLSDHMDISISETRSWVLRTHPDPGISEPAWRSWNAARPQ